VPAAGVRVVHVVAAALIDGAGAVLVAQRGPGGSLGGLWEFPGGKIEPGETPESALVRELAEELGVNVHPDALASVGFVSHGYADFHLVMLLYTVRDWVGEPSGQQGQALRWTDMAGLKLLPMPPADVPLLPALAAALAQAR
jgi:8-oxo-dGTP diphosphatase